MRELGVLLSILCLAGCGIYGPPERRGAPGPAAAEQAQGDAAQAECPGPGGEAPR